MTRSSIIGHKLLKYFLVFPALFAFCLGIFADGAFKYTIQSARENAAFEIKVQNMSLKELGEVRVI